jgi:ABC-type nitrate/sulfonate/bicarbonate transport system substrate-binding protein
MQSSPPALQAQVSIPTKGEVAEMKRVFTRVGVIVAVAALVAVLGSSASSAAVAGAGKSSSSAADSVTFVEAGSQDFSSADVLFFVDLMKKNGINVNFQAIPDAASALRTVISGQADIFLGSLPTAINAVANGGAGIKVIAANDQATDYVLVAQKGVTLQNISGKTLAIDSSGSAGHVISKISLQDAGVNPDAPRYVTIGSSSARLTAILAGRVDIAPLHYPLALQALDNPNITLLLDSGKTIGAYLQSGLIASDGFLKNKALTQKVVNAFINAERWANAAKFGYLAYAQSKKLDVGLTGPQQSKVWDYYRATKFFGVNGGVCAKYIAQFIKLNNTVGTLPTPMPPLSSWLNSTFAKNYLKAHKQKTTTC